MKELISRSSLITSILIVVLMAATPLVIWEYARTGDLYVLSRRLTDDMIARLSGPGRLRFILQPTAATLIGVRDGVADARAGRPAFLIALASYRADRRRLVKSALASIRDLIAVAIIADCIVQLIIFQMVHPAVALVMGPVLIGVPYAASRALSNRAVKFRGRHVPTTEA